MKKVALVILSIITVLIQPVSAQLPGVIAYYSFEGNADDQSGNGFDAELVGNAVANGHLTKKCHSVITPSWIRIMRPTRSMSFSSWEQNKKVICFF